MFYALDTSEARFGDYKQLAANRLSIPENQEQKGPMSQNAVKSIAATALLVCAGAALAQNANGAGAANAALQNVLQLSASGSVEVPQDVLVMRLSTTKEGSDAAAVQAQLKEIIDAALKQAKRDAKPEQMEVRTGDFSLYPRNSKDGKISGWQGRAEIILEGKDFSRVSTTAGALQNLTVASTGFSLSREGREKVEGEAQAKAISAFKERATQMAKNFGFSSYTLREVSVSDNQTSGYMPMPMARSAALKSSMDAPVPVEAGKARVEVTVSGSVQLR